MEKARGMLAGVESYASTKVGHVSPNQIGEFRRRSRPRNLECSLRFPFCSILRDPVSSHTKVKEEKTSTVLFTPWDSRNEISVLLATTETSGNHIGARDADPPTSSLLYCTHWST